MADPQKAAIETYLKNLNDLTVEKQRIGVRISKMETAVRAMIDLLDTDEEQIEYLMKLDDITPPAGLTEAITQLLRSDISRVFFPVEIRDKVKSYLRKHSNKMASVHTTLKRMVKAGTAEPVDVDGKIGYRGIENSWLRIVQEAAANQQD